MGGFHSYDYEEVPSEGATSLVEHLDKLFADGSFIKSSYTGSKTSQKFTIASVNNFTYTDPIDGSVSKNQGHILNFADGSRVVFRLSGTGSQGATVRMYVERYSKDPSTYKQETAEGLKGLIEVALEITKLPEFLGRSEPTVITVSVLFDSYGRGRDAYHDFIAFDSKWLRWRTASSSWTFNCREKYHKRSSLYSNK